MATQRKKSTPKQGEPTTNKPSGSVADSFAYLKKLDAWVRGQFAGATDLPTFLANANASPLTLDQKKQIVQQALVIIEQNYSHLPLKRAMHSIDPVQRLKLFLQTLELAPQASQLSEVEFHQELTDIFTSLRDLHTCYCLPQPFSQNVAFLPFIVEDYFDGGQRKYLVSHVVKSFQHETFTKGVEVVYWNGMPIERAVWQNAQRHSGSNREARHAKGVQQLTVRALMISPPPDEEWVVVGYRTADNQLRELRFDWLVGLSWSNEMVDLRESENAAALGIDLGQHMVQQLRLALFAPKTVAAAKKAAKQESDGNAFADLRSKFPQVFQAQPVITMHGMFGYVRVRSFDVWPVDTFVEELVRLIGLLPQNGLIIDVRGNGGGIVMNGELILQTLTPKRISPEIFQFTNTDLNFKICQHHGLLSKWANLSQWVPSMREALLTGAAFSAGFPISDLEECNTIGQKYFGPVVLITDALCYSTTDIFAAGFQDHEIGPILGVDGNTGAGGANVWEHQHLKEHVFPDSVYEPLPNGAGMRVAIRRSLRVGPRAGTPVEDLGVTPDVRHFFTRNDLLEKNVDLIDKACSLLVAAGPARGLNVSIQKKSPTQIAVIVNTQRMSRIDIYLNDRPLQSIDIENGQASFSISVSDDALQKKWLEIRGYDQTQLVARYLKDV